MVIPQDWRGQPISSQSLGCEASSQIFSPTTIIVLSLENHETTHGVISIRLLHKRTGQTRYSL